MITMIVLYFVNLLHPLLQEEMQVSIERSAFILKFKGYIVCQINPALRRKFNINEDSSLETIYVISYFFDINIHHGPALR